jgi:hypothetical protein
MNKTILALLSLILLVGCQSTSVEEGQAPAPEESAMETDITESYGQPYSAGPSGTPDISVTGPNAAPPEKEIGSAGAQAVTTSEDIRLTLPRKTD